MRHARPAPTQPGHSRGTLIVTVPLCSTELTHSPKYIACASDHVLAYRGAVHGQLIARYHPFIAGVASRPAAHVKSWESRGRVVELETRVDFTQTGRTYTGGL